VVGVLGYNTQELADKLITFIDSSYKAGSKFAPLIKKYEAQLPQIFACLCTSLAPSKKVVPNPAFNAPFIGYLLAILFGIAVIGIGIFLFVVHKKHISMSPTHQLVIAAFALLGTLVIGGLITWWNPKCLFRRCGVKLNPWTISSGTFSGQYSVAGITIKATMKMLSKSKIHSTKN